MQTIKLILTILSLIAGGSVLALVLMAAGLTLIARRALLSAIRALGCPFCSASLSEHSIELADELWGRHMSALAQQNPGVRFRIVRPLDVVCESCGARLQYVKETRSLVPISIVLAFEAPNVKS
ncbi:MAG TPA: hypothetical protein VFQ61_09260 [Polyangiaceae bacterium]|nr:hypothetical protein [Polyangiaceae bacterium]